MATTMNPVDLYSDPALDGLVDPSKPARRTSHNRRPSGHVFDGSAMPPAPEVPRGPPISYRGGQVDSSVPQRSFSQRAQSRPFAREAFEEDEYAPRPAPVPQPAVQRPPPTRQQAPPAAIQADRNPRAADYEVPQAPYSPQDVSPMAPRKEKLRVDTNMADREDARTRRQAQTAGAVPSARSQPIEQQPRRPSATQRQQPQPQQVPLSAVSRSSARAAGDGSRDWAPDRSPLQKLEVTLNDISKEEKRARMQEAEMLLRETKARQAMKEARADQAPQREDEQPRRSRATRQKENQVPNDQSSLGEAGLVRSLSKTHRDRLQHSTTMDNHRPDARRLSGEGKTGFDYSQSQAEPAPVAAPRTADATARRSSSGQPRSASTRQAQLPPQIHQRAVSEDTAAHGPPASRLPADRDRNASHKATLAKLTGASPDAAPVRTGSRKLQKAPPIDEMPQSRKRRADPVADDSPPDDAPVTEGPFSSRAHANRSAPEAMTPPPRIRDPNGIGAGSPAFSSPMSSRLREGVGKRQSKSSVTFKEPISKRPVDEWKEAKTARLSLADFELDKPAAPRVEQEDRGKAWWEEHNSTTRRRRRSSAAAAAAAATGAATVPRGDPIDDARAEFRPRLFIRCGPLLRYLGLKSIKGEDGKTVGEIWRGSIMIVTQDSHSDYSEPPRLRLFARPKRLLPPPPEQVVGEELAPEYVDPIAGLTRVSRIGRPLYVRPVDHLVQEKDLSQIENDEGLFEASPSLLDTNGNTGKTTAATNNRNFDEDGESVGKFQEVLGVRLYADPDRDVTFWRFNVEVELADAGQHVAYRINRGASSGFWVPARGTAMNIMFHSCNGFSLSVNPDQFSGPDPLWRDVLNVHQTRPFHVMIGGGDQIYNDRCTTETQLFGDWLKIRNPQHKHHAPFTKDMQEELESFYLNRYCMWFSQGLFGMANSQIPMVNIWDDHDIIDGFGSYPDHFMKTPVFSGLGNAAFKYYMLFQHQSVPEETAAHEPSWVLGYEPGPYINQLSRHVFMHLGKQIAFLGVDCRTERMRDEILSVRTFDNLLERCRSEIVEGETKHLLILLGVPIAYPRLVWLENVLTSKAMDPIKALNRMGIMKTGFLNKFDGGVEILDDLDDHWTASHHKNERNDLISDLQDLAAEKSVRITILGGDVHLAAVGQFRSNPKLKIPKDHDHRYMPNVISSAIVNTPPPDIMADILNKRNKVHTMDKYTEEDMIPMFTHDVDRKKRNNTHLLPRRNWCSIRQYMPGSTPPPTPPETMTPSVVSDEDDIDELSLDPDREPPRRRFSFSKEPANLIRKLSAKRPPPSAYPQGDVPQRSASYDGTEQKKGFFGRRFSLTGSRRSSADSGAPMRSSSLDRQGPSSSGNLSRVRPGIMRRPTNVSEKAARKGNVPAIDAEGNEIDVNDTINLEGGLDVVLNVEVNQKDPAGITTPYRLLVPALWYDGSSDREKLPNTPIEEKKGPLLGRMFSKSARDKKPTKSTGATQGQGNLGQDFSDSESLSGEEAARNQAPRRRFSLFGSRRQKREELYSSDEESDLAGPTAAGAAAANATIAAASGASGGGQRQASAGFNAPPNQQQQQQQPQLSASHIPQRHTSAPQPRGQGAYDPNRALQQAQYQQQQPPQQQQQPLQTQKRSAAVPGFPAAPPGVSAAVNQAQQQQRRMQQMPETSDPLYDTENQPPRYHASQRRPVRSTSSGGQTTMMPGGVLPSQKGGQKRGFTIGGRQGSGNNEAAEAVQQNLAQHRQHIPVHHEQHLSEAVGRQGWGPAGAREQGRSASDNYPIQRPGEDDDDDESSEISSLEDEQGGYGRGIANRGVGSRGLAGAVRNRSDEQGRESYEATYPQPTPKGRRLSKQERLLGVGREEMVAGAAGGQGGAGGPLRGNGILGRHDGGAGGGYDQQRRQQGYDDEDDGEGGAGGGYSGIDAWRDPGKPRRGFSLKGVKGWLDGRREREREY